VKRARSARFLRDIWATFGVWVSKLQANVATRHDIFVSFFQANVSGKVATSVPRARYGAGEGGSKRDVFVQRVTLRAYQSSQLVTVASPMTPHAVLVLGTSRPSQWPPRPTDFSHLWWLKVPIGLETQRRGRGRSVEPISSRPYSGVWHAHMDHGR